jgi:hypothetical protein
MEKIETVRKITEWNPIGMKSKGHPKNRWRDEVLNDLKKLGVMNWTCLVKDRKAWYELIRRQQPTKGCSVRRRRCVPLTQEFRIMEKEMAARTYLAQLWSNQYFLRTLFREQVSL